MSYPSEYARRKIRRWKENILRDEIPNREILLVEVHNLLNGISRNREDFERYRKGYFDHIAPLGEEDRNRLADSFELSVQTGQIQRLDSLFHFREISFLMLGSLRIAATLSDSSSIDSIDLKRYSHRDDVEQYAKVVRRKIEILHQTDRFIDPLVNSYFLDVASLLLDLERKREFEDRYHVCEKMVSVSEYVLLEIADLAYRFQTDDPIRYAKHIGIDFSLYHPAYCKAVTAPMSPEERIKWAMDQLVNGERFPCRISESVGSILAFQGEASDQILLELVEGVLHSSDASRRKQYQMALEYFDDEQVRSTMRDIGSSNPTAVEAILDKMRFYLYPEF